MSFSSFIIKLGRLLFYDRRDAGKGLSLGMLNYFNMQEWCSVRWLKADTCLSCIKGAFQNETKKT